MRVAYPLFMLGGLPALGICLVPWGRWTLMPLLFLGIAASFFVERRIPYELDWNRPRGDRTRDWAHAAVNETVSALALAFLPSHRGAWPTSWPLAFQLVFAIAILDCGVTLAHWASHRVPLLWRFHAVHHSVTRHYGLNGLMKHPVHQIVEMAAGATPLLVLGIPPEVAALLALATALQLLLQHSNADYATVGFLALNRSHRFHHVKGTAGDVNFGLFTHLWDAVLGTWSRDATRRFTSDDFGLEVPYPTAYLAQLRAPFRS